MSIASDASVVTISSPSAIPNSDQSNSLTINPNGLLSVSPTDEVSTNTLGSHLPPTTQTSKSPANDNGVSVTGSSFMESSAQQLAIPSILMYFCILFSCLAMLLVFSWIFLFFCLFCFLFNIPMTDDYNLLRKALWCAWCYILNPVNYPEKQKGTERIDC